MLVTGCYTNRYIPDGSYRLDETRQSVQMTDGSEVPPEVTAALKNSENYYVQRRNAKVFGIRWLPVGMWIYSIAKPTDSTFWGNYWRRLGEAPVIYDEDRSRRTARQLQGLLQTKGCFNSTVTFDTLETDDKKIVIGYRLTASPRFLIDEVTYHTESDTVRRLLDQWREGSSLKAGIYYDQEVLASERSRLVTLLRERGYYRASTEDITFLVDTTYLDRHLSIDVNVDSRNLRVYHINNIFIYPNSAAGMRRGEANLDTTQYNYSGLQRPFEYHFVTNPGKKVSPKRETISRAMMLFPGMVYNPRFINSTYNSLLNLRNFKYINIEFSESPFSTDSLPLVDAQVRLINSTPQKLSLSLELTNASPIGAKDSTNFFSGGNLGIETSLEYQHKNLFGGAELLKVKGSLLLELPKFILRQRGETFYDNFSAFEVSLDASIDMPTFLLPFLPRIQWQRVRPHTLLSVGGSYQYRYWYERLLANTSYGYTWSQNLNAQHQLLPVELTFVRMFNEEFLQYYVNTLTDLRMKYQYSSHFIMDARYSYSYSNQQFGSRKNFSSFYFSLESAGNLLSLLNQVTGNPTDSNDMRQIFGVHFSQYVRFNTEFTRYLYHGNRNTFVLRGMLGLGLPYGNSVSMPYEKSFFGGGPTTLRAWQLRRLGPGSYNSGDTRLERVGDLQLVLNVEERFPIVGPFEGALFADMGNVWLYNASDQYPGGSLQWGNILKEIAVGVGMGLRLNVSIATLRLDFAIPLYDPGYDQPSRWRLSHWEFSDIVTNFGINYPF